MIQGIYNYPDQVAGTTLESREFEIGEDIVTNLVSARLVFEKDGDTTLEPELTILSASPPWLIRQEAVAAGDMNLAPGIHTYALMTIDENGELGTKKFIAGIMEIKPSPTFPAIP